MNDSMIRIPLDCLPLISIIDNGYSAEGFIHANRTLDVHVLLYIETGRLTIWEETQKYELFAGSLFFLKKGLHHYGLEKCEKHTSWYYVHFFFPDIPNGIPLSPLDFYKYKEGQHGYTAHYYYELPKHMTFSREHPLIHQLKELRKSFWSSNPNEKRKISLRFYELLLNLYTEAQMDNPIKKNEQRCQDLILLLEKQQYLPFQSSLFEKEMGLSFKHLNEIFKSVTGQTLQKYHNKLRMENAVRLLQKTTLPISEISEILGFSEPFYFSNAFKKYHGESPSTYRKHVDRT